MKEDKTSDATDVLLTDAPPIPGRKQADDSIIAQTSKNMSDYFLGGVGLLPLHRPSD